MKALIKAKEVVEKFTDILDYVGNVRITVQAESCAIACINNEIQLCKHLTASSKIIIDNVEYSVIGYINKLEKVKKEIYKL